MKKLSFLMTAGVLLGSALPLATAGPAAAGPFSCRPESRDYTVAREKVPVHARFRTDSRVVGFVYKDNRVHAYWDCTNGSGQPWVCVGGCRVDDEVVEGRWVHRGYLR
ncbi:hypothetical protein ABZ896_15720 [Streptomyces sp. NPDC047072]|uniref:hypothetical protein n=1 Tax=Streptomyces sp. NPDC047072 TaxID=3154809 RepID=UPI0033C356F2